MATDVSTIVSTDLTETKTPVTVESSKEKPKEKIRSKYRHVAALHAVTRPSCLSHESPETPSFLGFRNLMVLTIIVMNLRLVIENAKKYGLLITLRSNVQAPDLWAGAGLYAITPIHLFVAYIIERVAMEHAKGAVGRRKKSDAGMKSPESEKDRKDFLNTWWYIAVAHSINATLALGITSGVVWWGIRNPGIGMVSELHAIIVWLKTCSYAFTNRDLRHAMLHPGGPESAIPLIFGNCPLP